MDGTDTNANATSDANVITDVNVNRLGSKITFEEFAKRNEEVGQSDKTDVKTDWRTMVNIDEKYVAYKEKLTTMLEKHQQMWDGHLGSIKATRHYIELTEDARPARSHPYRAGPTQRELEKKEVEKMLKKGVIELSTSEWAAHVVFAPKKDGSLMLCIDYRRLNALTIRDLYQITRMDECIDSLGEETVS